MAGNDRILIAMQSVCSTLGRNLSSRFKLNFEHYKEDIIIILFFAIVSYFYLGANLFAGQIVAPMDLLLHYPGWKNVEIDLPLFNHQRSDILDTVIPQWQFARESLLNGKFPLWTPFVGGGTPVLPIFTSSLLTPSFLVFLILGGGVGFTLSLLVKLFFAGYGAYKLCRTELAVLPSLFGGITYMMCGFNASWLMWPHVTTSMWIPWILWSIIQLNRERTHKRVFFVAISVALLIFGGFPFIAFSGILLACLLICWLMVIDFTQKDQVTGLKSGVLLMSAMVAGFGLAAIQILPFAEWLAQFDTSWRIGFSTFSSNDLDVLWSPFKYTIDHGTNIAPAVGANGYVGTLTLLFSVVAIGYILTYRENIFKPLSPLFWIIVSLLIMIPVFSIPPFATMLYQLPILNSSNNAYLVVLLGLSFGVVGAYGLDASVKIITILDHNHGSLVKISLIIFTLIIIGIHIFDMAPVGMSQNAVVPADSFYPQTPTISYIQNNIQPGQSVIATSTYMVSGTLTYYGISEWFAHTYHTSSAKHLLGQVVKDAWASPTAALFTFDQINLETPLVDELGIRFVETSGKIPENYNSTKWQIMSFEDGIIILENKDCPPGAYIYTSSGRTTSSSEGIEVIEYSPNYREYRVHSAQEGIFVTITRIWPGWVAHCNDQPVQIVPHLGVLQSISIPEGTSVIKFTYVPYTFYIGLTVSILTFFLLLFIPRKFFSS